MTLQKEFAERQKKTGKTFKEQYSLITYLYYYLGETPSIPRILADIQEGYLTISQGNNHEYYFCYLDEADAKEAAISMNGNIISNTMFVRSVNFEEGHNEINKS